MTQQYKILGKERKFLTQIIAPGAISIPPIGILTVAIETGIGGWKVYQATYTGEYHEELISQELWQTVAAYGNKIQDPAIAHAYFPNFEISKYDQ